MKALMMSLVIAVVTSVSSAAIQPFELPWMNSAGGVTVYKSATLIDPIFVVEAYFLGCPYCNQNASNVNDLAEAYKNEPRVQVLDVGVDRQDSQYASWIQKHKPNHPVLKDANKVLIRQLGTTGYPSTYVIDGRTMTVVYDTDGVWGSDTRDDLRNAIDTLLKK
jgi:peroxiredoxin